MVYCLEKQDRQSSDNVPQPIWKRYAVCGKLDLLEQIRMGQAHPERWRVILEDPHDDGASKSTFIEKAG